ncbi:MAG: UDP-3-O-(3-hydroxymyristoyl)glucosamine N-acyltransferase [Gammaproteobacteria bacterium]|nr:UDP-3-O-(3-hydroxymyristoyl)glucosamine N-acyltransferase [Gammaproteobacteria bacterium]
MQSSTTSYALHELCRRVGGNIRGSGDVLIKRVANLQEAEAGDIAFLKGDKYKKHLANTRASAVILTEDAAEYCPVSALVVTNPYLIYARVAEILYPVPLTVPGVHEQASVEVGATIHASASVGAFVFIAASAELGENVVVGPGCVIGDGCKIGAGSRLIANVTLQKNVILGKRCTIHPGAVLGSDGFGNAQESGVWYKVPQLGGVVVGDDVEIGANTTVDRGALSDTVIENGVKLDNLIHIAHNVRIGANTAIAAHVAMAGSTTIGERCTIGGAAALAGHIDIANDVHITGFAMVTKSIREPGVYSSGMPAQRNDEWHHSVIRVRQLEKLMERVKRLEQQLNIEQKGPHLG